MHMLSRAPVMCGMVNYNVHTFDKQLPILHNEHQFKCIDIFSHFRYVHTRNGWLMESMIGHLNAAIVKLCLMGRTLKRLDWVACVCIPVRASLIYSCKDFMSTIMQFDMISLYRRYTYELPGFTYKKFSPTYCSCWICMSWVFNFGMFYFQKVMLFPILLASLLLFNIFIWMVYANDIWQIGLILSFYLKDIKEVMANLTHAQ